MSRRRPRWHTDARPTVTNPESGRAIPVGGHAFRSLTVGNTSLYTYDPVANVLFFRVDANFLVVTMIRDPSDDHLEPRASAIFLTPGLRNIVQGIVHGRRRLDELTTHPTMLQSQPFLAQTMAQFTWGPYVWSAEDVDDGTEPVVVHGATGYTTLGDAEAVADFLASRILADAPLGLPVFNAELNPGEDNRCVERFIADPTVQVPDTTINGLIDACKQSSIDLTLFDVMGGVISRAPVEPPLAPLHVRRAVIYQGHVYPLPPDTDRLTRISGPMREYVFQDDVIDHLKAHHLAYFRVGNRFLVGGAPEDAGVNGVWTPADTTYKAWMAEFIDLAPPCRGMDPTVQASLKASALSLYYADPTLQGQEMTPDVANRDYVSIDMTKCYWRTCLALMCSRSLPDPSLFDRWRPYTPNEELDTDLCYFRIAPGYLDALATYGVRTNVLAGPLCALLQAHGVQLGISHVVCFDRVPVTAQRACANVLASWAEDNVKKKGYAIINGILGRTESCQQTQFELNRQFVDERAYYISRYPAVRDGNQDRITIEQRRFNAVHTLMLHVHVVQMASYHVLHKLFRIRDACGGVMPVRIKVDSLTYRRHDLITPFHRRAEVRIQEHARTDWHLEPAPPDRPVRFMHYTPPIDIDLFALPFPTFDNITYLGPPGAGKTWRAMNLHEYDLAVCYSNKGARRVNGKTICSAFKLWRQAGWPRDLNELRNKVVFVDEAQAAGRRYWAMFLHAYVSVGTRFIFSMDTDQLAPVGEDPVCIVPFNGDVRTLTQDMRNEPCLIAARSRVLDGTFDARAHTYVANFEDGELTPINIAFTNRTCSVVNALVAASLGVGFCTAGVRVIAKATQKTYNLLKSEVLVRLSPTTFQHVSDPRGPEILIPTLKEQRKLLDLAYCTTIHKQIGETFENPFTIWDVNHPRFDRRLQYTAVTRGRRLAQITFRPVPKAEEIEDYLTFIKASSAP